MTGKTLIRKRRRMLAVAAVVVVSAGAASVGLAGADNGGVFIPELGITVPADKADAVRHTLPRNAPESTVKAPRPAGAPDRIPARMLSPYTPVPLSPTLIETANGWLVSDGKTLVAVYAGAAGDDATNGRFVIVRQNLAIGLQTQSVVNVPNAGKLRLVDTPAGDAVETASQHGDLHFVNAHGGKGILHLVHDTTDGG